MSDTYRADGAQSSSDFPIGVAFSQTFDVLKSSFWRFLVISAIPVLVFFVAGFEGARGGVVIAVIATVLGFLLNFILQSVIAYGAVQEMRGRSFDFAEAMGRCLTLFFPILGVAFLSTLLVMLGSIALLVPGLIALIALYVAVPVCLVERLGPVDSMSRSAALTKGFRWKIFGILLILGIGGFVCAFITEFIVRFVAGSIVAELMSLVVNIILTAIGGVMVAVVYYNLRVAKEGVDIDRIASVFD